MAIAKRFKISHDEVFPHGAFIVSPVTSVSDFDRSTRENKVQQVDIDTGLPIWQVDVLDLDPDASKSARTVTVKFLAKVQPVPPANESGGPITPVIFHGLSALPYVEKVNEDFSRIAWSYRADAMGPVKSGSSSQQSPTKAA
ncbi:plasmid replication, integration and excision activator [Pedococcus bigeumensis]|uniref:Plasmid replication, integration and excision activator n=1 Tax=Pedococcus bigeumensis TaxID=433644 RepID=A0A502CPK4_9MICO|nr:plasmid replication, integration and excision activator [Pedococcus bigeumensis]TPG14049.1 plasmid replication, integration and excision activator [Pedococcus bigeumensis]